VHVTVSRAEIQWFAHATRSPEIVVWDYNATRTRGNNNSKRVERESPHRRFAAAMHRLGWHSG
jgi:hypothetical protein